MCLSPCVGVCACLHQEGEGWQLCVYVWGGGVELFCPEANRNHCLSRSSCLMFALVGMRRFFGVMEARTRYDRHRNVVKRG